MRFLVLNLDYLTDFYNGVNSYWRSENDRSLKHLTLVSLGGGERDVLVNYHLTRLDGLVNPSRAISVSVGRATIITLILPTYHQCIILAYFRLHPSLKRGCRLTTSAPSGVSRSYCPW